MGTVVTDASAKILRLSPAFVAPAALIFGPFYLGLIHAPLRSIQFYPMVAGLVLALGTLLDIKGVEGDRRWIGADSFATWTLLATLIGSIAYLVALIF